MKIEKGRAFWRGTIAALFVFAIGLMSFYIPNTDAGQLNNHQIDSTALAGNLIGQETLRSFFVYVPDAVNEGDRRFPTVYWFPGWSSGATSRIPIAEIDEAIETGRIPPVIIVFVDIQTRFGATLMLNSEVFGNWEDFLLSEVMPFVDATYPTIPEPHKRGIMGFSAGGFTAFMLPILHTGIWGAIGANDPSTWGLTAYIRELEAFPPEDRGFYGLIANIRHLLPKEPGGYIGANIFVQWLGQVAGRISPNPNTPLRADFPMTDDGKWLTHIQKQWREYDFTDFETIERLRGELKALSTISIVVPASLNSTNSAWNIELMDRFSAYGIRTTRIDSSGDHVANHQERFMSLLENVATAIDAATEFVAVQPQGKLATTWGEIKQGK